ncbi:hypothetical protein KZ813_08710 [Sphingomonas sp. RHCKR7]|uniref:hypothetical protein n=1 Tax=Sphingomonas folli TaxID=2862497 RepID=UPI001CA5AB90|nr:hypothetical protein [Sphingomonas folli]MBW6526915.1 hypothetical protein [Sphingomonas folli]
MSQPPDLRRRRAVIGGLALLLLAMAQRETPLIGSITIHAEGAHLPRVSADVAPALRPLAAAVVLLGDYLVR